MRDFVEGSASGREPWRGRKPWRDNLAPSIRSISVLLLYSTALLRLQTTARPLRERSTPLILYPSPPNAVSILPSPANNLNLVQAPPLNLRLPSQHQENRSSSRHGSAEAAGRDVVVACGEENGAGYRGADKSGDGDEKESDTSTKAVGEGKG